MTLDHSSPLALAHTITGHFSARHRTALAGLYGSTARNTDTLWSDLELLFVVQDGEQATDISALYQGTAVSLRVYTVSSLEHLILHPDGRWPMTMGILSALAVLNGDPGAHRSLAGVGGPGTDGCLSQALTRIAPALVFESCGRIHSCAARESCRSQRGDTGDVPGDGHRPVPAEPVLGAA